MANPFIIPVRIDAKGVTKGLNNISSKFKNFGKNLTLAVSLPLAGIATAASKMALGFDESLTKINTLVGVSKKEIQSMRGEVMKIAGETAQAPEALADALFTVTSAGLRGKEAMEVLNMAAKSSASGLGDTKSVAGALTGVMQSYAKSGMTAQKATDILTATVRAGNLEASELAPVLGRVTGLASTLGIGFEEVGASIATFTRLGVKSSEAVTGLSGIMRILVKPTDQTRDALLGMGTSVEELRAKIQEDGLAAALADLVAQVGDDQDALGELIPDVSALAAVLGTAGAQGEDYVKVAEEIANSTGLADQVFKDTAESASFKFKKSLNQLSVVGTEIGSMLLPVLVDATTFVGNLVKRFMELDGTTKTLALVFGGIVAASGPLIAALGFIISPIGLIITGITTLGVVVYKNFDAIIGFIAEVINYFKDMYNGSLILKDPIESLGVAWETVVNFFKAGINSLLTIFESFGKVIKAVWEGDFDKIGDIVSNTFDDLKGEFKFAGEKSAKSYEEAFNKTLDKNLGPTTKEGLKTSLANTVNDVKGFFKQKGQELGSFIGLGAATSLGGTTTGGGGGGDAPGGGGTSGGGTGTGGGTDNPVTKTIGFLDVLKEKSLEVAELVGNTFGNMGMQIVESFGLATEGIQGFLTKILEGMVQIADMVLQDVINRKIANISIIKSEAKKEKSIATIRKAGAIQNKIIKKGEIVASQASATASAIEGGAKSGAGTGIGAIFTTPAFIATLVATVLGAFASIPKFAKGGIVTGPMLGMVGEAGPEAIIPLDKMSSVMGSQKGEFVLKGSDLVLALDRANNFQSRITG